jgi:short-subunit dehydrogenase
LPHWGGNQRAFMGQKTILITGASSGIGAALARVEARPGVTLLLWGRNAARLEEVAKECRAQGAEARAEIFDLSDSAGFAPRLAAADAATPIDLAIFNAGLGGTAPADAVAEAPETAKHRVVVTLVSPGFIDTPMSRKVIEPKPFLMKADAAAKIISRRIARGDAAIVVPWQFGVMRAATNLLPRFVLRWVLARS